MKDSIRVAIGCCNRLLREAIARILAKKPDFEVVSAPGAPLASAASGEESASTPADVLVLDSLEVFLQDTRLSGDGAAPDRPDCVLVAMEDNREHFLNAIRRGVRGYVLRDASAVDVVCAIRAVAQGQAACPPAYTRVLFDYIAARVEKSPEALGPSAWGLTRREQQLIPLMDRGLTNKEIASHFHLSEQTVKNHVHRMMRKMRAASRLEICQAWRKRCAVASTSNNGYFPVEYPSRPLESTEY